jgi:FkbM family methyltransferase
MEAFEATRFDHAFSVSYSQGGEDLALLGVIGATSSGKYLDIGAHHPSRFSVTRLLYEHGWSGVNVDANPALIPEFLRTRPQDISLAAWVGDPPAHDRKKFYVFEEAALSTASLEYRDRYVSEGNAISTVIETPVITLAELIRRYLDDIAPTLLNVDCEGGDEEVLRSGDWGTHRPHIVVVETTGDVRASLSSASVRFLVGKGYEPLFVLPMATVLRDAAGDG